jgi:hypothetical protein
MSLGPAVSEAEAAASHWPASESYWFSGTGGIDLTQSEGRAVRRLWTRLLVALAMSATGVELDAVTNRQQPGTWLGRMLQALRSQSIEGRATTLLERRAGPDVWRCTMGVWNACCAALLWER